MAIDCMVPREGGLAYFLVAAPFGHDQIRQPGIEYFSPQKIPTLKGDFDYLISNREIELKSLPSLSAILDIAEKPLPIPIEPLEPRMRGDDEASASFSRSLKMPLGEKLAVISYDPKTGIYSVQLGYIPGKSPNSTLGAKKSLPHSSGPYSLQKIVAEAEKFEDEKGAPVAIRPDQLPKMAGDVIYPANAFQSVTLIALDRPFDVKREGRGLESLFHNYQ